MNFSSMNLFNCFLNLSRLLASTTSCGNEFQFNHVLHEKILPFCVGNYFLKNKTKQKKPLPLSKSTTSGKILPGLEKKSVHSAVLSGPL